MLSRVAPYAQEILSAYKSMYGSLFTNLDKDVAEDLVMELWACLDTDAVGRRNVIKTQLTLQWNG